MSWREKILEQFNPEVDRVTLAADPDALLLDEHLAQELRGRGLEVMTYTDPVGFRFEYESKYRSRWDQGEAADKAVIIRIDFADFGLLPYDLLRAGPHVSLGLADLFPWLSYSIIASLDRSYLDMLYTERERHKSSNLGENESKDFILRHVFGIFPEYLKTPSELLLTLLRINYGNLIVPDTLKTRLKELLNKVEGFRTWPLETLILSRDAFFEFLQERWPAFLERINDGSSASPTSIIESAKDACQYRYKLKGPFDLPFDHPDVRGYINNLFFEGLLKPVEFSPSSALNNSWAAVGIKTDHHKERRHRIAGLIKIVEESLPGAEARHRGWMAFARRWAELSALNFEGDHTQQDERIVQRLEQLQASVDAAFTQWVKTRYGGLYNQASLTPVMLHHVPRMLARKRGEAPDLKVALVLMDGLALSQWVILRQELAGQRQHLSFREEEVFAWVPTLTSVSRQSVFAGKPPIYFHDSLNTTSKEPALWRQFWAEQGLPSSSVTYSKVVGDDSDIPKIEEAITDPRVRVAGIVVAKVDQMMHGEQLGMKGMHDHVRLWSKGAFITDLLDLLISHGFEICITSDHGNIQAEGVGNPSEGALAGYRGERVRVFSDEALRKRIKEHYQDAVEWPAIGLPDNYLPLLAPVRSSFVTPGERRIAHGGIAIEELIVPLIYVTQKK